MIVFVQSITSSYIGMYMLYLSDKLARPVPGGGNFAVSRIRTPAVGSC